ncbi:polyprenyl synthetase family protein [Candidatus Chloroploca sp. Khr17]|uniref:polyprenyl synthetase family protein n=1 Tax=Candidatus Chloroploca sp. Khr17 TaxID=2496869 RepID=UPI00101C7B38|nr:polyprenyl synthetase family protein [Candidatus Chloroploca sp. Khr17]
MIPSSILSKLATELGYVQDIVRQRTAQRTAIIQVVETHLFATEDAYVRAALVILAAQTGTYHPESVAHVAAAVELIHAATRAHDVLVDAAARRRGALSDEPWAHGIPLMVGDYLFALASGEMALSPDRRVIDVYAEAVMQISASALAPVSNLVPFDEARRAHYDHMTDAHAALFKASCRAGAICGGFGEKHIDDLGRFGVALGCALRLLDEVSLFADMAVEAPAAVRLGMASVTLPMIFAAAQSDSERLAAALDTSDPAEQTWAINEVRRHGIAPTCHEILRLTDYAQKALSDLPHRQARDDLLTIAQAIGQSSHPDLIQQRSVHHHDSL